MISPACHSSSLPIDGHTGPDLRVSVLRPRKCVRGQPEVGQGNDCGTFFPAN